MNVTDHAMENQCRHYTTDMVIYKAVCRAGVHVRTLVGGVNRGWANRMPCFRSNHSDIDCPCRCFDRER